MSDKFGRLSVISKITDKKYYWLCKCDCGQEKLIEKYKIISGVTKSCGCLRRQMSSERKGIKSSCWKHGVNIRGGYKRILTDCPRKYKPEHRIIMEKYLGRNLNRNEVIHHINGVKTDNKIENLMLFSNNSEHVKFHKTKQI